MCSSDLSTSAVDIETEARIQEALAGLHPRPTSFVIAQRISTVRNADLILVLDKGRLAAQGRHEDLMENSAIYAEIYSSQLVEDAQVAAANCKWQMANSKWQMANSKWQIANGKWQIANGK